MNFLADPESQLSGREREGERENTTQTEQTCSQKGTKESPRDAANRPGSQVRPA